ncbi:MAG: galactofuranosyltransferase, partial [Liquorilactobacillus hordei]|uniref:galactofuranosyltransferase n=1 Tax=Liquorilactobacillus hordei TaxID=468911 RepID=UPI0039EA5AB9
IRIVKREDISLLKRCIIKVEEKFTFKQSRWIIVHNETMSKFLRKNGVASRKLVSLNIFDYLVTNFDRGKSDFAYLNKKRPIIIAGTLRVHKASYAYHLPSDMKFNLYGPGFTGKNRPNIDYKGSFAPNKLPNILDGSFGLVWDGDSIESCTGIYGEYMEINNPHKASLYLSAGIPVIIWSKAALSKFILDNKCGFTVNSIFEIKSRIASLTDEEYGELKKNAEFIGSRLRKGFYLKKILSDKNINF